MIKRDCSWIGHHTDAIPETKEIFPIEVTLCLQKATGRLAQLLCKSPKNGYVAPRDAQPAKDWWESASEWEYKLCLREHGL
jgi:hypothetical protein